MKKWFENPLLFVPGCFIPLWLAFPPFEWRILAWVGLAPAFYLLKHSKSGPLGWLGAGWGLGLLLATFQYSWLFRTMVELGGVSLPFFSAFFLIMVSFLALFPAVVLAGSRWLWLRWEVSPYLTAPLFWCLQDLLLGVFPFGGSPWGSLAATQTPALAARVLAPLVGGSGLVLVIAAVNAGWAWAGESLISGSRRGVLIATGLALGTLLVAPAWPLSLGVESIPAKFSALLVPGEVPVTAGGDERANSDIRYYLGRTMTALDSMTALDRRIEAVGGTSSSSLEPMTPGTGSMASGTGSMAPGKEPMAPGTESMASGTGSMTSGTGPMAPGKEPPVQLVIWPEAAVRGHLAWGKSLPELSQIATLLEVDLLIGSDAREKGREVNSAYLVKKGDFNFDRYDKRELVPFGEYVPAGFGWFFGKKITRGERDYLAGKGPPVLNWRGYRLGMAICFESILPGHILSVGRANAQVLVVMANDQWLTGTARIQHLNLTALRAMEIGRDVLYVANGGWTGHLRNSKRISMGNWEGKPVIVRPDISKEKTPWVRWGYGPLAILLIIWCVTGLFIRNRLANCGP